jgi:RNA polymerase sporulation-specific sigma factor
MRKNDDKNAVRQEDEEVAELLSLIRVGRADAFPRLVQVYHPLLLSRVAAFSLEGDAADDAYSEATLALYRAALRYREGAGVTFGLYAKICIDNALKTGYKKSRHGTSASDGRVNLVSLDDVSASELAADFSAPLLEKEAFSALVSRLMAALSSYEKTVFTLYYINGIAVSEVAKQLGKEEKSVKNAISRIVIKLRKELGL